jgi:hypothetical protein
MPTGPFEACAAEHAVANEFRFKDYPNEMKFTPVTDQAIAEISKQYGLVFQEDFRAFLKAHNGFYFDRLTTAEPVASDVETFDYVRYLFGLDNGHEYNDLRIYLALPGVWDRAFCAFAYPVSDSRGGDPIVQVYRGKARGKIYFVDHEVLPDVGDLKPEGIDLETMSADEALEYLIDYGCFLEVATSFTDYLAKLTVYERDGGVNVSIRRPLA